MKTHVKIGIVFTLILFAVQLFAQQGERKPPSIEDRVNKTLTIIEKDIEINDSQKAVIEEAFRVFFETVDQLIEPGKEPPKEAIEDHEKARDKKVKAALTTEQYEEYLKMSCKLRPHPNRNNKGERPPKH